MKICKSILFPIFFIIVFCSCNTNTKLKQESAEQVIKTFVRNNPYTSHLGWGQQGTFEVSSITVIEPVSQFSETEAEVITNFNFRDAFAGSTLKLKFIFKKNMEKQWILTTVSGVNGVGSVISQKSPDWQNLSILAQ